MPKASRVASNKETFKMEGLEPGVQVNWSYENGEGDVLSHYTAVADSEGKINKKVNRPAETVTTNVVIG